jgi:hypothetical protein
VSDAGGIYIPWYLWTACAMVWILAFVGLATLIRALRAFVRGR